MKKLVWDDPWVVLVMAVTLLVLGDAINAAYMKQSRGAAAFMVLAPVLAIIGVAGAVAALAYRLHTPLVLYVAFFVGLVFSPISTFTYPLSPGFTIAVALLCGVGTLWCCLQRKRDESC